MGHICIFLIFPFSCLSTRSSAIGCDVFVPRLAVTVGLILKQLPGACSQVSFIPTSQSFISSVVLSLSSFTSLPLLSFFCSILSVCLSLHFVCLYLSLRLSRLCFCHCIAEALIQSDCGIISLQSQVQRSSFSLIRARVEEFNLMHFWIWFRVSQKLFF